MIFDLLEKSKETKSLIEFNLYGSDNDFFCGYVLECNENFAVIQHYSNLGTDDGIITHKVADISYLESDTEYLTGIKLLSNNQDLLFKKSFNKIINIDNLESFTSLFETFIGSKDFLIQFYLSDDQTYYGFIEWCDENYFSIINIDNDGTVMGKIIFKFEDLKLLAIDNLQCRKRFLLHKSATSKK